MPDYLVVYPGGELQRVSGDPPLQSMKLNGVDPTTLIPLAVDAKLTLTDPNVVTFQGEVVTFQGKHVTFQAEWT